MEVPGKNKDKTANKMTNMFCEPCDENDETRIAEYYCIDCNEFLCKGCAKVHRKSKMSRHHELIEGDKMPKKKLVLSCDNTCYRHDGKLLEYFCNNHTGFCCASCVTLEHSSCKLQYITEKADSFEDGEDYRALTERIQKVTQRIFGTKDKINVYKDRAKSIHLNLLEEIQEFRNNIETIIKAVEDNATEKAKSIQDKDVEDLNYFSTQSDEMAAEIEELIEELDHLRTCKQTSRLCIAAKQAETKIDTIETKLADIETKTKVRQYNFRGGEIIKEKFDSWGRLELIEFDEQQISSDEVTKDESDDDQNEVCYGTTELVTKSQAANFTLKDGASAHFEKVNAGQKDSFACKTAELFHKGSPLHANQTNKAILLKKIYIRHKRDTNASGCFITAMTELTNNRILLTDYNNLCLKIVDIAYHTIVSYVKLTCRPWDITLTENNSLVASCCDRLIFFSVHEDLEQTKEVDVNGQCSGVTCQGINLLLIFTSPKPCLKILNMEGVVVRTIPKNPWVHIFTSPNFVIPCSNGKGVIISDEQRGLVNIKMNGSTNTCKENILQSPFGMTAGQTGTILVAGRDSDNVVEVSEPSKEQGKTKMRVILSEIEGPLALVYNRTTERLYISHDDVVSDSNDYLSVFQL